MASHRTTKRKLVCQLTDAEKITFGEELARLRREYAELEIEAAESAKGYRDQLAAKWERMGLVSEIYETGQEEREIECAVIPDHAALMITYRRTDTGEVVGERLMDEEERQGLLPIADDEATPAADDVTDPIPTSDQALETQETAHD
ncbi:MAG TPA: hypothetical protein VFG76_05190 [Candidatus Polarisedimenticolia bacterium]|nr:hypothetical protein [Candidatus Polarisedimenticolia bacterium]